MKPILLILGLLFFGTVAGQSESAHWFFGEKAALDFGGGTPIPVDGSSMVAPEGSASISDKQGNLLFYTNGLTIWNKEHQVMDNGEGLKGNTSSTQSSIIIPFPGKDSLYYVFVVDNHAGNNGVTYSLVNMSANNGLGKVVSKSLVLTTGTTEKITAVHHCNNKDVWLLVRLWNSNSFYTFQIDKNGIVLDPIISVSPFTLTGQIWGTLGSMKISPNATKVAAAHGWGQNFIELGDFNRLDGQITNVQKLSVSPPGYNGFETGPYGLEFSPNSRFLYVYCAYGGSKSQVYQFDLSLGSIGAIQQSRQLVTELPFSYAGSMQLAPDQKIYLTNSFDSSLSVINAPNLAGTACDFQNAAVSLGKRSSLGLPNFIQSFIDPDFASGDFTATGCETGLLTFSVGRTAGINAVKWDFGDPNSGIDNTSTLFTPQHRYLANGFYPVTLLVYRSCSVDTIRKNVYSGALNLGLPDRIQGCTGDSALLSVPNLEGATYRWSNGERSYGFKTTKPGFFRVVVTAGCRFTDSTTVVFGDKPEVDLGSEQTICTGQEIVLDAFKAIGKTYTWSTGAQNSSIRVNTIGSYWVRVTDPLTGCQSTDTILVKDKPFPRLFLGNDTIVCETELITLDPKIREAGLNYLWQDGSTEPSIKVGRSGVYILRMTNNCTIKSDTIRVSFQTCPIGIPNAFTPNGDGRNDRFRVKYGEGVSQYLLRIHNRLGRVIFESREQTRGWDGTMGGVPQPSGTYVWVVTYFNTVTRKPVILKGSVQLVR